RTTSARPARGARTQRPAGALERSRDGRAGARDRSSLARIRPESAPARSRRRKLTPMALFFANPKNAKHAKNKIVSREDGKTGRSAGTNRQKKVGEFEN